MICTKCHAGLPRDAYPKAGEDYWNEAQLSFVAKHEPHNRRWAHGWKIAASRAILIAMKYGKKDAADLDKTDRMYRLYVEAFHEDIIRGLKT